MAEVTFADWTERLKVFNDYIRALGDFKVNDAEAKLKLAQAESILFEIRKQEIVLSQLQRDLKLFNKSRGTLMREAKRVEDRAKRALLMLRGSSISLTSFNRAWSAYIWFEPRAMLEAQGSKLFDIKVPASAKAERNFIALKQRNSGIEAAPKEIKNGLEFFDWLHEMRFMTRRGSDAQKIVRRIFESINTVAKNELKEMRDRINNMKNQTYDVWNLPAILGAPENASARNIEQASVS